jgi:hypothetical protein
MKIISVDGESTVRYPKALADALAATDYPALFKKYREVNGADVELSYLSLGLAAGELAVALTPTEPGTEPVSSLRSRLPEGEMNPEEIFDFLTDTERENLERATVIVELIRSSFSVQMNAHRWSDHG